MKIYLINKTGTIDITEIVTSVTLSGEYRSCCRTIDFGIIKSQADLNTYTVPINLGDNLKLVEGNKTLFYGIVWTRDKGTDRNEINIHCKDFGIYLLKNKQSYKSSPITPQDMTRKVCKDFGIKTGKIAAVGKTIKRNFLGVDLYSIIMSSYTVASNKKYMCIFEEDKLNVVEKGIIECKALESEVNLLTTSVSESLDDMVNKVNVFNKENNLIKVFQNTKDIKKYGTIGEYIKVNDDKEDYTLKANKILKGVEQKITVTNFGDVNYVTGKSVTVTEPYTGLKGKFYIDADEHNWKNGIYTNKLTLNFKNLMDEKESGSEK